MKKSKLIEILNALPGNPEIKLWNGMVGDWMDIDPKPVASELVKLTEAHYLEGCRLEECIDRKDWTFQFSADEIANLKKMYKQVCDWEDNPYVSTEDIAKKHYKMMKVQILQAKPRGVSTFDRIGDIHY